MEPSCSENCTKQCDEHNTSMLRLNVLEEQLNIVKENTSSVNKLATRVNLLMSLMSIAVAVAVGGATYTFTALSDFKDTYHSDKLIMQKQLTVLEHNIDKRFDDITERIIRMEDAIKFGHINNTNTKKQTR